MTNKNSNILHIVYASDKNYLAYCATSIISVLDNNKDKKIIFHILGDKIDDGDKSKFLSIKNNFINSDFVFYNIADIEEKIQVRTKGYAVSTFLRLFIGSALPEDIEKCLYIDADTMIVGDITQLWSTDIEDVVAGAVLDASGGGAKMEIGLSADSEYFNAGVLLLNLTNWRKYNIEKRCLEVISEKTNSKEMLPFADQDVLNIVFSEMNYWRACSLRYNFSYTYPYMYMKYKRMVQVCKNKQSPSEFDVLQAKIAPVIIHEKLWISNLPVADLYKDLYRYYYKKNPFGSNSVTIGFLKLVEYYIVRAYWRGYIPAFFYEVLKRLR